MRGCIRQGDPTDHGGSVIGASGRVVVRGRPVALLGDKVSCPIRGHRDCFIETVRNPRVRHDGVPVAMEGDLVSCGAVLMSSAPASGMG